MGLLTNPNFNPLETSEVSQDAAQLFVSDADGIQYRVVDGDTIERVEDGQSFRVSGVSAAERHRNRDGEYYQGEVHGNYDKKSLYEVLNNEGFSLSDLGKQEGGQGGGRRNLASITTGAGVNVSDRLFELGLATEDQYTTQEQIEAKNSGELQRALFGDDDGYSAHRDDEPLLTGAFKTRALTEGAWYNPDYHFGVEFDRKGVNLKGQTTNPLSTAWDVGVNSAMGDFGGFLEALGHSSPLGEEWLKVTGQQLQGKANQAVSQTAGQRVGSWSQLHAESDSGWDYIMNGIEWIGVNTVQSAPYLGAVAVGAGATLATGGLGGGAIIAGAAASTPLAAMHAGNVWNQIERFEYDEDGKLVKNEDGSLKTNKNAASAGKAMVAGVAMASLDRLGISGAIGINSILTKEGRDAAVDLIINKTMRETGQKLTKKQAMAMFNNAARDSTIELIEDMGRHTIEQKMLKKGIANILGGAAAQLGKGAVSEGLTEASQELTAYLVSAQINNDAASIQDMVDILSDNWEEGDNIKELLIESAAAGTAVGGGIGLGSTLYNLGANQKFKADYLYDAKPGSSRETEQIFIDNDATDGTIGSQIYDTKEAVKKGEYTQGLFNDLAESGKDVPYWKQKLYKKGRGSTALTPIEQQSGDLFGDQAPVVDVTPDQLAITPTAVLDVALHYSGKLVNAPLAGRENLLRRSKAIRSIYSRLSKARGGGSAGRTAEQQIDWIESNTNALISKKWFQKRFGMRDRPSSRAAMTGMMREYGKHIHGTVKSGGLDAVTDQQIANMNKDLERRGVQQRVSREDLPGLLEGAQKFEVYQQETFDLNRRHLVDKYGDGSKEVKDYDNTFDSDWWWSHRDFDKQRVARDKKKFIQFIDSLRKDALKRTDLTPEEKKLLSDPDYAENQWRSVTMGRPVEGFSRVGGQNWAGNKNRRLLDVGKKDVEIDGEKVSMSDFESDDIFQTMEKNTRQVAQDSTILEYFGDGGADLDVLMSQARQELEASGMSEAEVDQELKNFAKDTKNVIDSITGDYNRIKDKRIEAAQATILQYTTITGLLLSGISSIPEFGTVALDLAGNQEAKAAINTTAKNIGKAMTDLSRDIVDTVDDNIGKLRGQEFSQLQKGRVDKGFEGAFNAVLDRVGLTPTQGGLYKKLGLDENTGGTGFLSWAHDAMFKINQLERITTTQRAINAAQAVDFIRNRAERLAAAPEGEAYTGRLQQDYQQLRQLGLDVPSLIEQTKQMANTDQEFGQILTQSDDAYYNDYNAFKMNLETGIKNFVDFRVQNPGAANRPLWSQDPHFRLITQFNGFTSTVTTTIVPKLWYGGVGEAIRKKNPAMAYNTFAMIVLMCALGGASQWVKDILKYGESSPHLENSDLMYRALLSSGVLGQFEKAAQIAKPLYSQPGEGPGQRVLETAAGPIGRTVGNVYDAGFYAAQGNTDAALRSFLKNVPVFSSFPGLRNAASGRDNE